MKHTRPCAFFPINYLLISRFRIYFLDKLLQVVRDMLRSTTCITQKNKEEEENKKKKTKLYCCLYHPTFVSSLNTCQIIQPIGFCVFIDVTCLKKTISFLSLSLSLSVKKKREFERDIPVSDLDPICPHVLTPFLGNSPSFSSPPLDK